MGGDPVAADDNSKSARPFDVRTLKSLIALMNQHDLSEIDLREGTRQIRLTRGGATAMPISAPAAAHTPLIPPAKSKADQTTIAIKSPTPGTFYKSPDP